MYIGDICKMIAIGKDPTLNAIYGAGAAQGASNVQRTPFLGVTSQNNNITDSLTAKFGGGSDIFVGGTSGVRVPGITPASPSTGGQTTTTVPTTSEFLAQGGSQAAIDTEISNANWFINTTNELTDNGCTLNGAYKKQDGELTPNIGGIWV